MRTNMRTSGMLSARSNATAARLDAEGLMAIVDKMVVLEIMGLARHAEVSGGRYLMILAASPRAQTASLNLQRTSGHFQTRTMMASLNQGLQSHFPIFSSAT